MSCSCSNHAPQSLPTALQATVEHLTSSTSHLANPLRLPLLCRWYNAASTLQTTITSTCFIGTSTQAYGNFIGNASSWTHVSTWSGTYYNLTAPTWHSWANNAACTALLPAICEIPVAAYACPSSPPPASPPPPVAPSCELYDAALLAGPTAHCCLFLQLLPGAMHACSWAPQPALPQYLTVHEALL